ncbi:MAG: outer membrane lipoprotein carrier protein LolA [Bacteroidales bacterium]|nr:outer membrane lipoprotein carrier protein LolA [Bacteroidales bacterium]MDD4670994.1 outer membrane lipoprotein carrier protein LolA [Bacteroidales bacterium]
MKQATIIISFLLLSILPVKAQTDNEIIANIEKASKEMTSLQCSFTQKKQVSIIDEVITSSGVLYYLRDTKLCWEYKKPYSYKFIMNGDKVMLKSGNTVNVFDTKSNKMFSQISKLIISGVDGSGISDKTRFDVSFATKGKDVVVTLVPKTKDIKKMFSEVLLHFDVQGYFIKEIEMIEPSGDKTDIILTDRIINKSIDEKVFHIE